MRTTIRQGSFETNSSSTHSLTLLSPTQYQMLCQGNTFLACTNSDDLEPGRVYTLDELLALGFEENTIREYAQWESFVTFDPEWRAVDYSLERDVNHLTTPGGEDIVIVCTYGNDY